MIDQNELADIQARVSANLKRWHPENQAWGLTEGSGNKIAELIYAIRHNPPPTPGFKSQIKPFDGSVRQFMSDLFGFITDGYITKNQAVNAAIVSYARWLLAKRVPDADASRIWLSNWNTLYNYVWQTRGM